MIKKILNHFERYAVVYLLVASFILGAIIFSAITRAMHHCPKCPELVSRSHVERDSVIIHDTVRIVKYAPSITVKTVAAVPTPAGMHEKNDSMVAYEVIDTMPDKAVIGFSIASSELPDRYLPDLVHTAWYLAKPDRIRIISDTLTVQLPPLPCPPRWKRDIAIGGICIGIGAAAATTFFIMR